MTRRQRTDRLRLAIYPCFALFSFSSFIFRPVCFFCSLSLFCLRSTTFASLSASSEQDHDHHPSARHLAPPNSPTQPMELRLPHPIPNSQFPTSNTTRHFLLNHLHNTARHITSQPRFASRPRLRAQLRARARARARLRPCTHQHHTT